MKQAEVKVGETYETKVGQVWVPVVVVEKVTDWKGRTRFRVRRSDNSKVLPLDRTAAALQPVSK